MPRSPTGSLGTHFAGETTTLARLLTINRSDGETIRLTDHDADLDMLDRALTATGELTLADVTGGEAVATGTLSITSGLNALDGETVTIGSRTYTFETVFTDTPDFVLIGVDRSATLLNLANAINNGPGEGTTYGTGTVPHADVTATSPTQSSTSGIQIAQSEGTVVGNMTNFSVVFLGFGGDIAQSFDGVLHPFGSRTTNLPGPAARANGGAYVGKDFSAAPRRINSVKLYGSNNEGFWLPAGKLSLAMFIELRGKVGAIPADDAAYITEGVVLGTHGPFINDFARGAAISPSTNIREIISSDNTTEFDHLWITMLDIASVDNNSGNYLMGEVEFFTTVTHAGAGDMGLEAKLANDEGNAFVTSDTLTNGGFGGGTLSGGADAFQNIDDGETVTIGTKVYTFQDVLTDVDGNVLIGSTAFASLSNLKAAIDLDAGAGSTYAASMTEHPDVTAGVTGNVLTAVAEVAGSAGNDIATTDTLVGGSWAAATLLGGEDAIYLSVPGFVASSSLSSSAQGIEGVEITTIEGEGSISQQDVLSGRYAEAQCILEYVNWENLAGGFMILFAGIMGGITNDDESALTFEIQGKFTKNRTVRINTYQPNCRADLGDADCKFDIFGDLKPFTITAVNSGISFNTGTDLPEGDDFWKLGIIRFLTGNNAGISIEISSSTSVDGEITMFLPAPLVMQIGDTGEAFPGCDKTIETCIKRFGNVINFRGEPFAPQEGALFAFKG